MLIFSRSTMLRSALALVVLLSACSYSHAQGGCVIGVSGNCSSAPEIDPSLGTAGGALLAGSILLIRGRRRR